VEGYSFGEWLRQRRSALLLSREDLAHQVGCAVVTLRKIEADERRPSQAIAERLADLLELSGDDRMVFIQVARGLATADRLPPPIPRGSAPTPSVSPTLPPATPILPNGTVTFLFTDIVGSTQLWEQHPQAMPAQLARHDAILRQAITTHDGVVFKTMGDAVYATFARFTDALAAALAAQRALQAQSWGVTGPLRVRMALHTGLAKEREGDYFGPPLNRVARLLAAGHGGQILLSLATAELVREHLPADAELRDLGTHRLKDLNRPEQIFQLVAPDLPATFPPLNTLDPRRINLPAQPTPLIGREEEVATISELLRHSEVRLLTLAGPGGTGKTRLGFQVAAELLDDFAHGVYFVNLAPISDPSLVAFAIAQALEVTQTGDQPLLKRLQSYLREKRLLLLLDNFEQVLDAAPLIAELLAGCPKLTVLVTSRVPLHLRGEKEIPVSPLALPDLQRLPQRDHLTQYAAVELFIQRALDAQPTFVVTNENAPAVAEICARLDGLPLAIELAAARTKLFAPEALLARLSRPLVLLTGGARDLPARQQTLRSAIAWSYDLLEPGAQTLFARLGVFVGGCTTEAAEGICNGDSNLAVDVLDGLALLVDNSLLRREAGADGEPSFVMLETIREYALERLEASGELQALQRQHAEYFLRLAEEAKSQLYDGSDHTAWMWRERLERDYDNLRMALAWALGGGEAEVGVRLVVALMRFWEYGYWGEGRSWSQRALAASSAVAPELRAMVLLMCGWWDHEHAPPLYEEALELFRSAGDASGVALTLMSQGELFFLECDYPQATRLLEESLVHYLALGDRRGSAEALHLLGDCVRASGDLARAEALLLESVASYRALGGQESRQAGPLGGLGDVVLRQGDIARATALYWEAFTFAKSVGDRWNSTWPLHNLSWLALVQGDDGRVRAQLEEHVGWCRDKQSPALAFVLHQLGALVSAQGDATRGTALLREALTLHQQLGREDLMMGGLDGSAWLVAGLNQPARAARLLGVTESVDGVAAWRFAHEQLVATVRAQLDEATFARAREAGQAMTLEQAIAYALEESDGEAQAANRL
jgi:predicted ATPase/class 3 adenylate cyclase/DNA-binding XRE family transcriptional regulator